MPTFQATIADDAGELLIANRIAVVESHIAATPIEADLIISAPEGTSPEVVSVSLVTSTSIRVNFVVPAEDNDALSTPENYKVAPALTVHSVIPEAVASPTYVDLVIDEQEDGIAYSVTLQRIVKA